MRERCDRDLERDNHLLFSYHPYKCKEGGPLFIVEKDGNIRKKKTKLSDDDDDDAKGIR